LPPIVGLALGAKRCLGLVDPVALDQAEDVCRGQYPDSTLTTQSHKRLESLLTVVLHPVVEDSDEFSGVGVLELTTYLTLTITLTLTLTYRNEVAVIPHEVNKERSWFDCPCEQGSCATR
jgi:hypothetical protein